MEHYQGSTRNRQDAQTLGDFHPVLVGKLLQNHQAELKDDHQKDSSEVDHILLSPLQSMKMKLPIEIMKNDTIENKKMVKKLERFNTTTDQQTAYQLSTKGEEQDKFKSNNSHPWVYSTVENEKKIVKEKRNYDSSKKASENILINRDTDQSSFEMSEKKSKNNSANITFYPKKEEIKNAAHPRNSSKMPHLELKDNCNTIISDYDFSIQPQSRASRKQSVVSRVRSVLPPTVSPTENARQDYEEQNPHSPKIRDLKSKSFNRNQNRAQPVRMSQPLADAVGKSQPYNKKKQLNETLQFKESEKDRTKIPLQQQINSHNLEDKTLADGKDKQYLVNYSEFDRLANLQTKQIQAQSTQNSSYRNNPISIHRTKNDQVDISNYATNHSFQKYETDKQNPQMYISVESSNRPENMYPYFSETKNKHDESFSKKDDYSSNKTHTEQQIKRGKFSADSLSSPNSLSCDYRKALIGNNTNAIDSRINKNRVNQGQQQDENLNKINIDQPEQKSDNSKADAIKLSQLQHTFSANEQKKKLDFNLPQLEETKRKSIPIDSNLIESRNRAHLNNRALSLQARSKIPCELQQFNGVFHISSTLHNTPSNINEKINFNQKNQMQDQKQQNQSFDFIKIESDCMLEETGRFGQEEDGAQSGFQRIEKNDLKLQSKKKQSFSCHQEEPLNSSTNNNNNSNNITGNTSHFIPNQIAQLILTNKIPTKLNFNRTVISQEQNFPAYQQPTYSTKSKVSYKNYTNPNEVSISSKGASPFNKLIDINQIINQKQPIEMHEISGIISSSSSTKNNNNNIINLKKATNPPQGTLLINYNFPAQVQNIQQQQPAIEQEFSFQKQSSTQYSSSLISKKVQSAAQGSRNIIFYPQILCGDTTNPIQVNNYPPPNQQSQKRAKSSNNRFPREIFTPNVQKAKRLNSQNNQSCIYKNISDLNNQFA